jgi:hypothetical protein
MQVTHNERWQYKGKTDYTRVSMSSPKRMKLRHFSSWEYVSDTTYLTWSFLSVNDLALCTRTCRTWRDAVHAHIHCDFTVNRTMWRSFEWYAPPPAMTSDSFWHTSLETQDKLKPLTWQTHKGWHVDEIVHFLRRFNSLEQAIMSVSGIRSKFVISYNCAPNLKWLELRASETVETGVLTGLLFAYTFTRIARHCSPNCQVLVLDVLDNQEMQVPAPVMNTGRIVELTCKLLVLRGSVMFPVLPIHPVHPCFIAPMLQYIRCESRMSGRVNGWI